MDTIKVIVLEPEGKPIIKTISYDWETMEDIIGGNIEMVKFDDSIVLCREGAKQAGLKPNCIYSGEVFYGTIIVARAHGSEMANVIEED